MNNSLKFVVFIVALALIQVIIVGLVFAFKRIYVTNFAPKPVFDYSLMESGDIYTVRNNIIASIDNALYDSAKSSAREFASRSITSPPDFRNLEDILQWNPDDYGILLGMKAHSDIDRITSEFIHGAQVPRFDFSNPMERKSSLEFRRAQLPFVLYNVPDIQKASKLWTNKYLIQQFGPTLKSVEKSRSNKFMYYTLRNKFDLRGTLLAYVPPQNDIEMSYIEFSKILNATTSYDKDSWKNSSLSEHYYFTINANEVSIHFCFLLGIIFN